MITTKFVLKHETGSPQQNITEGRDYTFYFYRFSFFFLNRPRIPSLELFTGFNTGSNSAIIAPPQACCSKAQ